MNIILLSLIICFPASSKSPVGKKKETKTFTYCLNKKPRKLTLFVMLYLGTLTIYCC